MSNLSVTRHIHVNVFDGSGGDKAGCEDGDDPALDSAPATRRDLMRVMQRLEGLIAVGHEAEMKLIDDETNALAAQIEALVLGQAAGEVTAGQLDAFRGIVEKLKAIAHAASTTTNSET